MGEVIAWKELNFILQLFDGVSSKYMNAENVLQTYPEILSMAHLEKIFGKNRRTIKRWRASKKVDLLWIKAPGGKWAAVKESVIRWMNGQIEDGGKL